MYVLPFKVNLNTPTCISTAIICLVNLRVELHDPSISPPKPNTREVLEKLLHIVGEQESDPLFFFNLIFFSY